MEGGRVLVIDDSTTLRKVVEIAMRGTGCEVDFAASGSDGVSRARALRPDVILLDYLLPDLPSAEVCKRLCDDAVTSGVPVVIMSSNERGVLDDFRGFASVGGFIGKPFTPTEIRSRLETAMRGAPGRLAAGSGAAVRAPASASGGEHGLELRGELAATPLLDVLRLLAAAHATGVLVVEHATTARIWLRRGEILVASSASVAWDALAGALGDALTPALRDRVTRNLAAGKPPVVSLAEAGVAQVTDLPLALHAASAQTLGALLDVGAGRFTWEPAGALPDFVDAFGRHVSLTALALEHARRAGAAAHPPGALDRVYDRVPGFSHKLAGAQLDADEQRVLAALDGQCRVRNLAVRARLPVDRVAAIVDRLRDAELIHDGAAAQVAARRLAVLDADRDDFIAPLRARLGRRAQPIDVIELDPGHAVAAATLAAHAELLLISVRELTRHVLDHELPVLARDGSIAVVGILESPDPALAGQLLQAGLHAVIAKPVHFDELERLLFRLGPQPGDPRVHHPRSR